MASYQPTILPAKKQPLEYLFSGLNSGIGNISKILTQAMVKEKFGTKKEQKLTDYGKLVPQVIAGLESPTKLPNYSSMRQSVEATNPGTEDMLDAGLDVTDAQGNPFNEGSYDEVIKDALANEYAPGLSRDQIKRKAIGMPVNVQAAKPAKQGIPKDFSTDFKAAYESSAGDEAAFIANLKKMSIKYADNPGVLSQIKKLIDLNTTTASKGSSSGLGILEE